jgi:hypothetical protein
MCLGSGGTVFCVRAVEQPVWSWRCRSHTVRARNPACADGASNICDHGSHVAGIAANEDRGQGFNGVAPGAFIIAIQVFTRSTATRLRQQPWRRTLREVFRPDQISG